MVKLTDEQNKMYDGEYGPGVQKAMAMLVKYGDIFGAECMIKVDSAHVDIWGPVEVLSQMLEVVDQARAFTTVHSLKPSTTKWAMGMGIRPEVVEQDTKTHEKRVKLYQKAGFLRAFTCAPYLVGNMLRPGTIFSQAGTSGIIIGNSLFGARGNRDAVNAAICSAITGVTPKMLLHRPENRRAELVAQLQGLDLKNLSTADFGALGYYIGAVAGLRNVAVVGIPSSLSFEKLKYFLSAMPVSGGVSLCHIVGVTPEAPTLEAALGNGKPQETIEVGKNEIEEIYQRLNTAKTDQVDLVCLGCPHYTISEIKSVAQLLDGRKVKEGVRVWVSTADSVYTLAKRMGYVDIIEKAGGLVVTDMCMSSMPALEIDVKTSATDSAKVAHYQPGADVGVEMLYGSTEQCIATAITGKWGG